MLVFFPKPSYSVEKDLYLYGLTLNQVKKKYGKRKIVNNERE